MTIIHRLLFQNFKKLKKNTNVENFYVLKIRLNSFEISKQVLKFENFGLNLKLNYPV